MRGAGLFALWALGASAHAETKYSWIGEHACVVETASGYQVPGERVAESIFSWSNAPKSLFVTINDCETEIGQRDKKCEIGMGRTLTTKFSPQGQEQPLPWHWQMLSSLPFFNSAANSFSTFDDGRFTYVAPGATTDKHPAVFIATGSCTPFSR